MSHENRTVPELPPIAAEVDQQLAAIDEQISWLHSLSPIHNARLWREFKASGHRQRPHFEYLPDKVDYKALRQKLFELPISDIELPAVEALLAEKQRELDRQMELVRLRDTAGFVSASIDLFGTATAGLLATAKEIMATAPVEPPKPNDAGLTEFKAAAEAEFDYYREQAATFAAEIIVEDDLNSMLMVSNGNLHIAADIHIPESRIDALIQHEVGTHVVTRHNGANQPLRQLACGLAHYDALQEGLGVLSEYLAGNLPAQRLRIIAARVIATDMAIHDRHVPDIYAVLTEQYSMVPEDAFDVAVRAMRGGGLTKDVAYLDGLSQLHAYLVADGEFEILFMGKFAMPQMPVLEELLAEGWLQPPELLPRYLNDDAARQRLDRCRRASVAQLFQTENDV